MTTIDQMHTRFQAIWPHLDEKGRRLWAASEAKAAGRGGLKVVHEVTGLSRTVISEGKCELAGERPLPEGRIRRAGAGRKSLKDTNGVLLDDLKSLVESSTMGDPESPLLWTTQSLRSLAAALQSRGHKIGHVTVGTLLAEQGYSLQGNRKTLEGTSHPDRDAQFQFIRERVEASQEQGQPVISVDTKKKELVGFYKNGGRSYRPKGDPVKVKVHDFEDKELGKVAPYGVYDLKHNEAWVNVGTDYDTSAFAVESIRQWWRMMGKDRYPSATRLMITADSGGSNGARVRLWKKELQKFANDTGLEIQVSHFPPGTSKWNKIEHRLFSAISLNWRGRPLINHEVIINLIESTTTRTGLKVRAGLDTNHYPKGIRVSDAEMNALSHHPEHFHGEWNYTIAKKHE
ncbi:MAG: ISAzo13 family transposase [Candidatus Omnitrophica bacterium]|nr:ISAzo13 family transposase [Candidatus Omnitrophota bacterium]